MSRYRIMLRCDSLVVEVEGRAQEVGFFTTRAVDAETPEQAIGHAIALVRQDARLRSKSPPEEMEVRVEEVDIVSWWWRRFRPPAGFTFFRVNDHENGATSDEI